MKKRTQLILTIICLLIIISIPAITSANNIEHELEKIGRGSGYDTEANDTGLSSIAGAIIRAFLSLLGVVFISLTVYAGFLWMTASGNEEQITKAKKIMSGALVGLVITLSAFSIYYFISSSLLVGDGGAGETGGTP